MEHSVCFIGHRKIKDTPKLRERLQSVLLRLIANGTTNFIFGGHSEFDSLCYEAVTKLKQKYPAIKRIKFRKDYEDADSYTMQFLIRGYEESVCPKGVGRAGRAGYVERNRAMIRESDVCVFYYDENYRPPLKRNGRLCLCDREPQSGTCLAFDYAQSRNKRIINCFDYADGR